LVSGAHQQQLPSGSTGLDHVAAYANSLADALANQRAAAARTGEFTIRAPMAGLIWVRTVDNGQVISPETMLFQIGSREGVELQADVDEAYADALRPGMMARAGKGAVGLLKRVPLLGAALAAISIGHS
jgi:multidrug resistance efflux pump